MKCKKGNTQESNLLGVDGVTLLLGFLLFSCQHRMKEGEAGQVAKRSTGKRYQGIKEGWVGVTRRVDRLTACPAVPGTSDSLFDTSGES